MYVRVYKVQLHVYSTMCTLFRHSQSVLNAESNIYGIGVAVLINIQYYICYTVLYIVLH